MPKRHTSSEDAWEQIVLNAQKGEPFRIKFRDDPTVYQGIPVTDPGMTDPREGEFEFLVTEPENMRGHGKHVIGDVEWIERTLAE